MREIYDLFGARRFCNFRKMSDLASDFRFVSFFISTRFMEISSFRADPDPEAHTKHFRVFVPVVEFPILRALRHEEFFYTFSARTHELPQRVDNIQFPKSEKKRM